LAQGFSIEDALKLGVYVHGFAGDQASMIKGQMGLIASDVVDALPQSLKLLKESARAQ
jgi:NAD(P)H-hydrate epimerase